MRHWLWEMDTPDWFASGEYVWQYDGYTIAMLYLLWNMRDKQTDGTQLHMHMHTHTNTMVESITLPITQRFSTFWDSRTSYKFYLLVVNHHWKLCHWKLPKLACLCVYILKNSLCSQTTRQKSVDNGPRVENCSYNSLNQDENCSVLFTQW